MSKVLEIEEQYDTGYKVFEKLFPLSDKELKEKVGSILGSSLTNKGLLEDGANVRRVINNEKYDEITIEFYDWLKISPFGIYYHPEHGSAKKMIEFNKHFVL